MTPFILFVVSLVALSSFAEAKCGDTWILNRTPPRQLDAKYFPQNKRQVGGPFSINLNLEGDVPPAFQTAFIDAAGVWEELLAPTITSDPINIFLSVSVLSFLLFILLFYFWFSLFCILF